MTTTGDQLDLDSVKAELGKRNGKEYWRTLEELADREEFQKLLEKEFPRQASAMAEGVDRRDFVKLMGASLAMAGLTGCQQPPQKIVPYVQNPEDIVPGKPLYFATAMPMDGGATGLLVETHMGRPTKIEGNPDHPSSLGATDAFAQASILTMYDPERSQAVRERGEVSTWSAFQSAVQTMMSGQEGEGGAGLRILTQSVTSPTFGAQVAALQAKFPRAVWHQYEAGMKDGEREGVRLAVGSYAHPVYKFDQANLVLSFGADFLGCGGGHLRYTRDFTTKRRVRNGKFDTSRLYVVETAPSPTGSVADHRLPIRGSEFHRRLRGAALSIPVAPSSQSRWNVQQKTNCVWRCRPIRQGTWRPPGPKLLRSFADLQ